KLKKLEAARDAARGSSSPLALAEAEDAVIGVQASLKAKEPVIAQQLKYVNEAWEAYELGCDRLRIEPPEASLQRPSQDPEEPGATEPMEEGEPPMEEDLPPFPEEPPAGRDPRDAVTVEDDRMLDDPKEQQASAAVSTELSGLNLDSPSGTAAAPQD
ncbi:MAG: hypothetical protein MJE68_31925, partial [Proteobacteria bacterium]|nr:hypothetical protein [Pseudomonadota bacterium]